MTQKQAQALYERSVSFQNLVDDLSSRIHVGQFDEAALRAAVKLAGLKSAERTIARSFGGRS